VRNEEGVLAGTAESNADNFQDFYNRLLHNTGDTTEGFKEYARMKRRQVDRQFLPPIMAELVREVRNSKDAAPGENGVPAIVWKSMLGEPRLMQTLLDIMKKCWNEEQTPEEWRTYYMMAIPKKRGPDLAQELEGSLHGGHLRETVRRRVTRPT
jgi:hypothetical protein